MGGTKKLMIAAAFGLAGLIAIPAAAQTNGQYDSGRNNRGWHQERDRDHDGDRDHRGGYHENGRNGNYDKGRWGRGGDGSGGHHNGGYHNGSNHNGSYTAEVTTTAVTTAVTATADTDVRRRKFLLHPTEGRPTRPPFTF